MPSDKYYGSLGIIEPKKDILTVTVDFVNKVIVREDNNLGLESGDQFDNIFPYSKIKRCTVGDDGKITAYYGDKNFVEDGSSGQVMVQYPKFYYKVLPLELSATENGSGYSIRKATYSITQKEEKGFKVHPAFINENGEEVDYVYVGAYEGSIYDGANEIYVKNDELVSSGGLNKFCSIAGVKPASTNKTATNYQWVNKAGIEQMCKNRGTGWHGMTIKIISMIQFLFLIEYASFDIQSKGLYGFVNAKNSAYTQYNYSAITGSTSNLGNKSGNAAETKRTEGDTAYTETEKKKTSVSYRGLENIFGNIACFICDVEIYVDYSNVLATVYIWKDFEYAYTGYRNICEKSEFSFKGNVSGNITAFGYSSNLDWLFFPTESSSGSSMIGDKRTAGIEGHKALKFGGKWSDDTDAGLFMCDYSDYSPEMDEDSSGSNNRSGGRIIYIPA
jgi:hypothetical protein